MAILIESVAMSLGWVLRASFQALVLVVLRLRRLLRKCVPEHWCHPLWYRDVLVKTHGPMPWNRIRQNLDPILRAPKGRASPDHPVSAGQYAKLPEAEEGRKLARLRQSYVVEFAADGCFRVQDVLPGTYDLKVHTPELLTISRRFVIPAAASNEGVRLLDLGIIPIQ